MKTSLLVWLPAGLVLMASAGCVSESVPDGHRSPGKPRPPVVVRLTEVPVLQAGVPVRLRLQLTLPDGAESSSIEFDQSPMLQVSGVLLRRGGQLEAAVMPLIDAPPELAGVVTYRIGGQVQGSPFRMRLPGGQGRPVSPARETAPAGVLRADARDGWVMSLTAETTSH